MKKSRSKEIRKLFLQLMALMLRVDSLLLDVWARNKGCLTLDEWNEADHPRNPDGTFGNGGGKISTAKTLNDKICIEADRELHERNLLHDSEKLLPSEPIKITDYSSHAKDQIKKRNVTKEEVQSFVNNAFCMVQQSVDKFNFISDDGCSVVIKSGRVVTVIPKSYYDEEMLEKIEVVKKWMQKKTT